MLVVRPPGWPFAPRSASPPARSDERPVTPLGSRGSFWGSLKRVRVLRTYSTKKLPDQPSILGLPSIVPAAHFVPCLFGAQLNVTSEYVDGLLAPSI